MREIKFRAWDKVNKKMLHEGDRELDRYALSFDFQIVEASDTNLVMADDTTARLNLMQYTGLKDKNGKEIYEGDIVSSDGKKYEVRWLDSSARFNLYADGSEEVIGNIYENPDIL